MHLPLQENILVHQGRLGALKCVQMGTNAIVTEQRHLQHWGETESLRQQYAFVGCGQCAVRVLPDSFNPRSSPCLGSSLHSQREGC